MRRLGGRARTELAACALIVATGWVSAARAGQVPLSRVNALAPITLGFSGGADTVLASGAPATQAEWMPIASAEHTQMVRLDVGWASVAPSAPGSDFDPGNASDPEYNWTTLDEQVRELTATGAKIMISIYGAPAWAEGPYKPADAFPGTWEPSAADFGEFAQAIASRYDGKYPDPLNPGQYLPAVRIWQGWNEPNVPEQLAPQYVSTSSGLEEVAATLYRNLANAFYKAVKGVSKSDYVVLAGLAPYGDSPGTAVDDRTRPVAFLRSLLCVNATDRAKTGGCPGPTYFDAMDSHAYGIYGPNWNAYFADDVSVPDIYRLTDVVDAADRLGTALPAGPKQTWVTETSYNSDPPNPGGVPIEKQARWLEQSIYNFWKQGVSTMLWWQLADDPLPASFYSYQAGTYYLNGRPKPSATAFRFPFLSLRSKNGQVMTWTRAPSSGIVAIQAQTRSGWRTLARARVKADEVFELPLDITHAEKLRARVGSYTSLAWAQAG